jgi:hypothetical protein
MKHIVYVAGPYNNDDRSIVDENIGRAREVAITLMEFGYGVIVPHLNTYKFEERCDRAHYEDFQELYIKLMLKGSDSVLMLQGWQDSEGCKMEKIVAEALDHPLFFTVKELMKEFPPTILEEASPNINEG